jgi:hypothetical protein
MKTGDALGSLKKNTSGEWPEKFLYVVLVKDEEDRLDP